MEQKKNIKNIMEQKKNTSSASYGDNSSYRSTSSYKSTYEENTDEENSEEDSEKEETSDVCVSGHVVHRNCSPGKYSASPKASPVLPHRQVASRGCGDKISSPTELQARSKHTVQHDPHHVCTSDLNSPLMRKPIHSTPLESPRSRSEPIHSTPLESPRSRSQITSQRKMQSTVTSLNVSTESLSVKKKILSPRAEKSQHLTVETTPVVGIECLKQLMQENLSVILFFIVLVIAGVCALVHVGSGSQPENHNDLLLKSNQILEDFLQAFDELNSSFPAQTSTFWKVLRSGTRSIIVREVPVQPAVFIIAVPKDAQETALCIIRRYADIVTKAFKGRQPIEFTHHLRSADTPEHIKHVIDDTLNLGFSEGSRVAIIHELNKLHGKSAMMFHGYCDNENAPFTQVVIMFTLSVDAVNEETDDVVEKKLSQVWGRYLDSDTLFPLLSRIGNRNAFVRKESREVLENKRC